MTTPRRRRAAAESSWPGDPGGQFKVPFSPEELESEVFIPFIGAIDGQLQLEVDGTVGESENNQSARSQTTGRTNPRFQLFATQPTRAERYRWDADLSSLVRPAALGNGITGGGSTAEDGAQSLTAGVNWYATRARA